MLKKILVYFLGNALSRIIVFALLPIYTSYIEPKDYGYFDIVNTYAIFFSSILCMEIWTTMLRFIKDKNTINEKKGCTQSAFSLLLISIFVFVNIVFVVNLFVPIRYLSLVIGYSIVLCLQNYYSYVARAYDENILFAGSGVLSSAIYVCINLLLLIYCKMDYSALYISFIAGGLSQCLWIELKIGVIRHLRLFRIDKNEIIQMLKFSWPLGINVGAFWFLNSYAKTALVYSLGTEVNGYFSMGAKFGAIIQFLSSCLIMAWQEKAFERGSEGAKNEYFSSMLNSYLKLFFCSGSIVISFVFLVYPLLIAQQYAEGVVIVPALIVATILSVYSSVLSAVFAAIKRTKLIFYTTVIGALANMAVVHLLIPYCGIHAAAISMVCGFGICVFLRLRKLNHLINTKIDTKGLFIYVLPSLAIAFLCFYSKSILINSIALLVGLVFFLSANSLEMEAIKTQFVKLIKK